MAEQKQSALSEFLRTWGPALLIVIFIRSTLASPFRIPSGSMVPTLEIGDHILVSKLSYGLHAPWVDLASGPGFLGLPFTTVEVFSWGEPKRGDVVVFKYPPSPAIDYIKRVVGLPGDEIEVKQNVLYVNGEEMTSTFEDAHVFIDDYCREQRMKRHLEDLGGVEHPVLLSRGRSQLSNYGPYTVPQGEYFMMGDNRDNSSDSRVWGTVPRENIRGRAILTWLSFDGCEEGLPVVGHLRTDRLGGGID